MCASSWQEYKEDCKALGIQKKNIKTLLVFKTEIAESLCKAGKSCAQKKRGRPSSSVEEEFQIKTKRGPAKAIASLSVRTDQIDHFPHNEEKKEKCKMPGCKGITKVSCIKCKTNLCFTPSSNCFLKFHVQ